MRGRAQRRPGRPDRSVGVALGVVGMLLWAAYAAPGTPATPATLPSTPIASFDAHISHIVFLLQENHAFDSLFGLYCPTTGPYCAKVANGLPSGLCIPRNLTNASRGCVAPYNLTAAEESPPHDISHSWNASHRAWDNGRMDGFFASDGLLSLGHYNGTTVPVYWDLAEQYALADNFYSGALSYSLANHWYGQAARPPRSSFQQILGPGTTLAADHHYLNESNATPTLEDALLNSSVSWRYYDAPLRSYNASISNTSANNSDTAYDYWNPLAARAQSYTARAAPHFVARTQFFGDAANGTLPDLSWLIPSVPNSDHPPENVTNGQSWVASVVDALEASPEWNSTVLFVSWDEFGGFYDHVAPPVLDAHGDGFRVPMLAIGPWVTQGYLDGQNLSFSSILHLMEVRFGFSCLGARDCHAPLPLRLFNFGRSQPRAPIYIPPFANATYPMPLQSSGQLPPFLGRYAPPPSSLQGGDIGPASVDDAPIDWN